MIGAKWKCAAVALALLVAFFYLLPALMPFLLAYALTSLLRRPAKLMHRYLHLPISFSLLLLLLLLLSVLGFLAIRLLSLLARETGEVMMLLYRDGDLLGGLFDGVTAMLEDTLSFLPPSLLPSIISALLLALESFLPDLLMSLSGLLGGMLMYLPQLAISLLFFILAVFYFARDGEGLGTRLQARLPLPWRAHVTRAARTMKSVLGAYLRAYLCLFLLVFFATFFGFLLLGVRYAALLALLCAVVDILPVLGVGAVLLPYAALALASGKGVLAACLLVLYAAVFFLRSLAEPHLLSRKLGIHPLLSLFCMYGGYRLFGVWMMILAPLLASLAVSFLRSYAAEGKAKTEK